MFSPDLRALIFDFDRTLAPLGNFVPWREAFSSIQERYRAHGVSDEVLDASSHDCFGLYARVADSGCFPPPKLAQIQTEVSDLLARYEGMGIERAGLFPGVESLLADLARLELRAAIVSSNAAAVIRAVLGRAGVAERFDAVVGRDGLARIKPSPEGMQRCCALVDLPPAVCLSIGDNAGDVEAARAIGMPAVGVATGMSSAEQLRAAGALDVFDGIESLHAALRAGRGR